MNHPSDKTVLAVNNAVRELRGLFSDMYSFSWIEDDVAQVFEINAACGTRILAGGVTGQTMERLAVERFVYSYSEVETMSAHEICADVQAKLHET